jgi:hypothetical protein
MHLKEYNITLLITLILLLSAINLFDLYLDPLFLKTSYIVVFCISLIQIIRNGRHSKAMFLILLFIFSYYIKIKNYLFDQIQIFNPSSFDQNKYTYRTIFLYECFFLIFFVFLNLKNFKSFEQRFKFKYKNTFIFYFCIILATLITTFAKSGTNLFSANNNLGYGESEIQATGLIEYNIFIFLIAYLFIPNNRFSFSILIISIFYYCFKNILLGGRIETLQLFLCFFFIFLEKKVNWFVLIIILIGFYYISRLYEIIRLNPFEIYNVSFYDLITLPFTQKPDVSIDNQGEIFSATNRLFSMADIGVFDIFTRIYSFVAFLLSILLPYSILPDYAVLSKYLSNRFFTLGGGLIPAYIYVWFGFYGMMIFSFIMSCCFNYFSKSKNNFLDFYALLFFSTLPRWFAYNPITLLKLNIFGVLFYLFLLSLHYTFKKINLIGKENK